MHTTQALLFFCLIFFVLGNIAPPMYTWYDRWRSWHTGNARPIRKDLDEQIKDAINEEDYLLAAQLTKERDTLAITVTKQ